MQVIISSYTDMATNIEASYNKFSFKSKFAIIISTVI
jgi:hypothetical protein